ncbi:PHB depolymerase family esterase [Nonomuraea angiospora]|uniref:Poly(Hydroxyalkanoate) depolymerase family esterase n=1 Tax=Nonomuraea angiospora TaxID=46172 RepID=A0ABR9LQM7_9ACTN|nr:PHB depolymerase family esterase [Nonomuraea angiospora]MBE1582720.1 poly(hydroxyalkanoate) depolymerase family esterase [Nonomuraea angiospora]
MENSPTPHHIKARLARLWSVLVAGALLIGSMVTAAPASAAALTKISDFGSNPGSLNMYSYLPAGLPDNAPLVVALHGCTQSASDYYAKSGWPKYADLYGFALVFPEQPSLISPINYCFDWGTSSNITRGKGQVLSIYQMVQYAKANYHVNPSRIYVTGLSAGGGMAADLLAAYPDVFAAGSIHSGPAAYCSTTGITNTNCLSGTTSRTPKQWGDLIRNAYSGYSGPYPRVAIWHGSSDYTVNPAQLTYSRDGWTNVWGISQTPSSTRSLTGGTTENVYNDANGKPAVVTYSISGMGHGLAVNPGSGADQCGTSSTYYLKYICSSYYTATFFGLDQTGPAAPSGLSVTGTTDTSASLTWYPVSGAAGYNVYRNGTKINTSAVTSTAYTDTGLASGTSYSYTVAAVDGAGAVGSQSAAVNATTSSYTPQCFTASNYNHVAAGRAHQSGGYVYANGSNQQMGLWNLYTGHTLEERSAGYFVIADSGCPT